MARMLAGAVPGRAVRGMTAPRASVVVIFGARAAFLVTRRIVREEFLGARTLGIMCHVLSYAADAATFLAISRAW